MAGSNGTGTDVEFRESKSLPFISVSDCEARILSGIVTFIFTAYLTVGFLALLFHKFGFLDVKNF